MIRVALLLLGLAAAASAQSEAPPVHHILDVTLDPDTHRITVASEIRIPKPPAGEVGFLLHAGLTVESLDDAFEFVGQEPDEDDGIFTVRNWIVRPKVGEWPDPLILRIRYQGEINHPLQAEGEEYARSFSRTPGLIAPEGVFLSGGTWWVPHFDGRMLTYNLTVRLPEGWSSVSQGTRKSAESGETWDCPHPMEEIYVVANRFHEFHRRSGAVDAYAFLRQPDANLAAKFLETTAQYIDMYGRLIGPYPFSKFAVVENFWETGYGMPSFTLLGPRVIRFPFILHSSYPHEILHNWWGNSVYVDWSKGNWCEGLTAYLADHLIKEGQGAGVDYRRNTLKKFRNYVNAGKDFPLTQFRSRHSSATEAVGYGKALMLFHMLRRRIGEDRFAAGLQRFYRSSKFKVAAWSDLSAIFSEVAGEDLAWFFDQWTRREGAPEIRTIVDRRETPDSLSVVLRQMQEAEPFRVRVPVALSYGGREEAEIRMVDFHGREAQFTCSPEVVRIDVDPQFDVFRRLDREEIPASLGQLFGAERVTIVVPGDASWAELSEAWSKGGKDVLVVAAKELKEFPADRAVWVLGAENSWAQAVLEALPVQVPAPQGNGLSRVYTARHPANPELAVGLITTEVDAAIPGLARKLPHYGKYSHLAFEGDEPTNIDKGVWPATNSPLVWIKPGSPYVERGKLPSRAPLAMPAPTFNADRLKTHIDFLADDKLAGRGAGSDGLRAAGDYIAQQFEKAGLTKAGDSWFQTWIEPGGPEGKPVELRNVIGVLPGTGSGSVVVGAHYDHLGLGWPDVRSGHEGKIHNGADDNASGIAVLIEVAKRLREMHKPTRSIVFVAFDGEEWGRKGSMHYVRSMQRFPVTDCFAMVNLDTVGRLDGRKIQVLGSGTASEWKHIAMGIGFTSGIASQCIADDPGGSDQVSFHEMQVPAVQIFSGLHTDYHRSTDTADKIDAEGMLDVASFVQEMVAYLSERDRPMTTNFGAQKEPAAQQPKTGRRVSLGTMPDFAFQGPGVKVASVIEGSPAAKAGVRAGDVLLAIDAEELKDLRGFSGALKRHAPGDRIKIRVRRGDQELEVEAVLAAR